MGVWRGLRLRGARLAGEGTALERQQTMLYTPLTKKAMKLCFEAHEGQVDKAGIPYANHPLHVAEQVEGEHATCAPWASRRRWSARSSC